MNGTQKILAMGQYGNYIVMEPDFEKSTLRETGEKVPALTTVPYGFTNEGISPTCGYTHESNTGLSHEEVRKKTFREFIEMVISGAQDCGAQYILLMITRDHESVTYWHTAGKWQYLV